MAQPDSTRQLVQLLKLSRKAGCDAEGGAAGTGASAVAGEKQAGVHDTRHTELVRVRVRFGKQRCAEHTCRLEESLTFSVTHALSTVRSFVTALRVPSLPQD